MILYRHLRDKGVRCTIIHQHSPERSSMFCGGRCELCGPGHRETPSSPISEHKRSISPFGISACTDLTCTLEELFSEPFICIRLSPAGAGV